MQTDRMVLRPRSQTEAMDLGFHLTRAHWPGMAVLTALLLIPGAVLAWLLFQLRPPLALLGLWWFKPMIDRALLHWLAADLVGRPNGLRLSLSEWRQWFGHGLLGALTFGRFHPARSATLPIAQLERLHGPVRRRRSRALSHGGQGSGTGLSLMASFFEAALVFALILSLAWLLPENLAHNINPEVWFEGGGATATFWALLAACYALVIVLIEPFYVGGGFGIYLNQRCRLECWDLEAPLRAISQRHAGEPLP